MLKKPWILGEEALQVILASFASEMGMSAIYADMAAQTFLRISKIPDHWNAFTISQCGDCSQVPNTCRFLNPKKEDTPPGRSVYEIRRSIITTIGLGRTIRCPFVESLENSDIRHLPASGSPAKESG